MKYIPDEMNINDKVIYVKMRFDGDRGK